MTPARHASGRRDGPQYFQVTFALATPACADTVECALNASRKIPGWFRVLDDGPSGQCVVEWIRCDALDLGILQSCANDADREQCMRQILKGNLLGEARRTERDVALDTNSEYQERQRLACSLFRDLADGTDVATVQWHVPAPVPAAASTPLLVPLRIDPGRRDDALTVVDCRGDELLHYFGDAGDLGEILWRANLHDHAITALDQVLQAVSDGCPDARTAAMGAAGAVLELVRLHRED